jgi:hypothetical protein|tara:strand:+ start:4126 stop:5916 length:1791 start_codon:yes stop_codon:yes gene_type:complete
MENKETIIEIINGSVSNRNRIGTIDEFNSLVKSNAWNGEMYRSYYSFDETLTQHVDVHRTVKKFDGLTYLDSIILDIDKGNIADDQFQPYLLQCLKEIEDLGIDKSHVNVWFSGNGYHVELLNVFGFQPSRLLHEKVKLTMKEHLSFADSIFDKTRIIRAPWSLNKKTGLYKIYIPYSLVWNLKYDDVKHMATDYKSYKHWKEDGWYDTLNVDKEVEPYLQHLIVSTSKAVSTGGYKSKDTTSIVTCMQHAFNEGPIEGQRNMKMMRMSSTYKRAGVPYVVALNGMLQWSSGTMDDEEIIRTVSNVYDGNYQYGCQDVIMAEYCDPKCIHFKRKDYTLDIKDVNELTTSLAEYLKNDITKMSVNMADIFNCQDYIIKPGELVVFSGDTGMGKSAFVQNFVTFAKKKTLFLSLEMNEFLTFRRFIQIAYKKTEGWVIDMFNKNPNPNFEEHLGHIQVMTIAPEIEAIKKVIATHEPNILVVDTTDEVHVDRVESEIQRQNTIIGALKEMAQKHNIIIVAVHHVNKISAAGNTIALHSLKGSTNVVQKADKVIMVKGNRDEKARVITSEKSRDDGKFEMTALFDYETMTFRQVDWSQQ